MNTQRTRNLIPPIYAVFVLAGFLISPAVGIIVLIVGGSLSGILWSAMSGRRGGGGRGGERGQGRGRRRGRRPAEPVDAGARDERAAARARRRSERR